MIFLHGWPGIGLEWRAQMQDHLGGCAAVWVGHDLGCPVVAALACHYPNGAVGWMGGRLSQPVLFINGDLDGLFDIGVSDIARPMRQACPDLTVTHQPAGHWLPLERKTDLVDDIRSWAKDRQLA